MSWASWRISRPNKTVPAHTSVSDACLAANAQYLPEDFLIKTTRMAQRMIPDALLFPIPIRLTQSQNLNSGHSPSWRIF